MLNTAANLQEWSLLKARVVARLAEVVKQQLCCFPQRCSVEGGRVVHVVGVARQPKAAERSENALDVHQKHQKTRWNPWKILENLRKSMRILENVEKSDAPTSKGALS